MLSMLDRFTPFVASLVASLGDVLMLQIHRKIKSLRLHHHVILHLFWQSFARLLATASWLNTPISLHNTTTSKNSSSHNPHLATHFLSHGFPNPLEAPRSGPSNLRLHLPLRPRPHGALPAGHHLLRDRVLYRPLPNSFLECCSHKQSHSSDGSRLVLVEGVIGAERGVWRGVWG